MGTPSPTRTLIDRLWRWFIAPSPEIEEQDKRRQAALLSSFLLGVIVIATVVELVTVLLIDWENYSGYRQTFAGVFLLTIIYLVSRTRHLQLAAWLAVIATTLMTFVSGWAQPQGVLGGLF